MVDNASRFSEHNDAMSAHTVVTDPHNAQLNNKQAIDHAEHLSAEEKANMNKTFGAVDGLEMGSEKRMRIEKRLKLKLDLRFSILVSIELQRDVPRKAADNRYRCEFDAGIVGCDWIY